MATGLEMFGLLSPDDGDQEYEVPPLLVRETGFPVHTVELFPAVTETVWIATFRETGVEAQPFLLYAVTDIVPLGPGPQFTETVFVPWPEEIFPPEAVQEKEVPPEAETL